MLLPRLLDLFVFVCCVGHVSLHPHNTFKIDRLDHLVITVADFQKTIDFYTSILGMEITASGGPNALHFGQSKINVHVVGRGFLPLPKAPTPGSADLCFITETDLDEVIQHVTDQNVTIIDGPAWRPGALGSITSIYFRDPDGNLIEVSNYN